MSENTAMTTTNEESMINALSGEATLAFCSMKAKTIEEKAALFRVMNNPEFRVADKINEVINVKDVYAEIVNVTNDTTGEVTPCPRIVLVDTEGHGYQAVSLGLYSALRKLMTIFGQPTWEDGLPLKVRQIKKGAKNLLTFDVVINPKK